MVQYRYEKFGREWSREIDVASLSDNAKNYAIVRGLHEALKDTFAGVAIKTGEGIDPTVAEAEAIADFESGL